jgi:arylsulfatase A-like enzyme
MKTVQQPNIIFLMDDQHRWDSFGFIDGKTKTPTLDVLAENGVFFSQAVCQAPMCIASRNSMMLGLYPNQIDVLRNEKGIPDEELPNRPLVEQFRDAGYETAGFGKTHWEIECSTRGFETRYIGECPEKGAVMMAAANPELKALYSQETAGYGDGEENNYGYIGRTSALEEICHRDGWVTHQCLHYLENRNDNRPLFLYLSFLKPHAAHNVPAGYEELYDENSIEIPTQPPWEEDISAHAKGLNRCDEYVPFWKNASEAQWKNMILRYKANCSWIDDMFGRVLDKLKASGILENALIVYLSDHGEMLGERYYRFNKYCLYESSVRVPILFSGSALPNVLKGTTDKRNVELTDIYPTLLKFSGIPIPPVNVGSNLLDPLWDRSGSFCALHEREGEASFMFRTNTFKLILSFKRKADAAQYTEEEVIHGELYNLETDFQEWNNLYDNKETLVEQNRLAKNLFKRLHTLKILYKKKVQEDA